MAYDVYIQSTMIASETEMTMYDVWLFRIGIMLDLHLAKVQRAGSRKWFQLQEESFGWWPLFAATFAEGKLSPMTGKNRKILAVSEKKSVPDAFSHVRCALFSY